VNGVHIDLAHDNNVLTLAHDDSHMEEGTSGAMDMSLDDNLNSLFGDIGVSSEETGLQSRLDLPPNLDNHEDTIHPEKDDFQVSVQDLVDSENIVEHKGDDIESVLMTDNPEFQEVSESFNKTHLGSALETKNFNDDSSDMAMGTFELASLSPGIFDQLESNGPAQFAEGIDLNDLLEGDISSLNPDILKAK